jgi:hypothetical protein
MVAQLVNKFPAIYGIRWRYRVHKSPPPVFTLSQINPVHISPPYFPKIHSNIIFSSTPTSSEWSLPFRLIGQISHLSRAQCMILKYCLPHDIWTGFVPLFLISSIRSAIKMAITHIKPIGFYTFQVNVSREIQVRDRSFRKTRQGTETETSGGESWHYDKSRYSPANTEENH